MFFGFLIFSDNLQCKKSKPQQRWRRQPNSRPHKREDFNFNSHPQIDLFHLSLYPFVCRILSIFLNAFDLLVCLLVLFLSFSMFLIYFFVCWYLFYLYECFRFSSSIPLLLCLSCLSFDQFHVYVCLSINFICMSVFLHYFFLSQYVKLNHF